MKPAHFVSLLLFTIAGNAVIYVVATAAASSREGQGQLRRIEESAGPIIAEPTKIDLGELKIQESKEFAVRLRNTGGRQVLLTDVSAGCACTDVVADDPHLGAGGQTVIRGRFRGKPDAGPFQVQLHLTTDNPDQRFLTIPILGTVCSRFPLSSDQVVLSPSFAHDSPGHATVTLLNDSDTPVELRSSPLPDGLELEINPSALMVGESAILRLTVAPDRTVAEEHIISIGTGHLEEPAVNLLALIHPHSLIKVTPPVLHLGVLTREEFIAKRKSQLSVEGASAAHLSLVDVVTPSFFQASPSKQNGTNTHIVTLIHSRTPTGVDLRSDIELVFCHRETRDSVVVRIPVSGFLKN